jgi:hypothetical protein
MSVPLRDGSVTVKGFVIAPLQFYLDRIMEKTPAFKDDGLSFFPDWIYKYILHLSLTPAGRIHDWHYCARCHDIGSMSQKARLFADLALRVHAKEILRTPRPTTNRFLRWVRFVRARYPRLAPRILYRGVRIGGGANAWNSCGNTRGELCRHNMPMPAWMKALG